MDNSKKILLVEGDADKNFFEQFCKSLQLNTVVKVAPPKDAGGHFNSKQGVFQLLPILLQQLKDGSVEQLAVVVDADYEAENGLGCGETIKRVSDILNPFGFVPPPDKNNLCGLCFKHTDGLADFGLWVMPNNQDEGMLEDWIKHCISPDERSFFEYAKTTVAALRQPKFKPIHYSKAEVATWLAWQKKPGHGLSLTLTDKLLDPNDSLYQQLSAWLKAIYQN